LNKNIKREDLLNLFFIKINAIGLRIKVPTVTMIREKKAPIK
jgi:hypothetical protein